MKKRLCEENFFSWEFFFWICLMLTSIFFSFLSFGMILRRLVLIFSKSSFGNICKMRKIFWRGKFLKFSFFLNLCFLLLIRMFPTILVFILFGLVAWKMRKLIKQKLKNKFQRKKIFGKEFPNFNGFPCNPHALNAFFTEGFSINCLQYVENSTKNLEKKVFQKNKKLLFPCNLQVVEYFYLNRFCMRRLKYR